MMEIDNMLGNLTNLPEMPNLIIIGGSSRNVGKTSLALELIKKYASNTFITGLKVTSIRSGEETFHGNHENQEFRGFRIHEEKDPEGRKDTSRMLKSGAKEVFYIEAPDSLLKPAFKKFMSSVSIYNPIVCESRSLRNVVIPGLFILINHYERNTIKPGYELYENIADYVYKIDSETNHSNEIAELINWDGNSWKLNPNNKKERKI